MCPACIASAVWIAAGAGSMGGLTVLTSKLLRSKQSPEKLVSEPKEKEK